MIIRELHGIEVAQQMKIVRMNLEKRDVFTWARRNEFRS
jgi:hypothetical protein